MAIETAAALHEALVRHQLLEAAQLAQIGQAVGRYANARGMAKDLVQRGLLTPYQINQLFQGNGRELVLGHYVLLERLGEGGMGQVFKARQQKLGRIVALKVIRKDKLTDTEAVQRFRREIQVVSQLAHPNVVAAIDADQADEAHFLIMEYVDGVDLGRLVREKGALPILQACEFVRQAALGLEHAHEKGLVHRDVKPSNMLLTTAKGQKEPVVKLLDLGLARIQQPQVDEPSAITQMGIVVGTPDYMSPEQARNASKADIRSDLYSLGCTLYFLLTGQVPFIGDTATEKLIKHCFEQPPPVEQWRPDVPPRVSAIVRKLMAKQPDERYQTPAKLIVALGRPGLMSPLPAKPLSRFFRKVLSAVPAVRENAPERLRKAADRRRWLRFNLIGGGVLAALLLVFGSLLFFTGASGRSRTTAPSDPNAGRLPLDALDAKAIPAAEHFQWQPKELVAVIGKHHGHFWGTLQALAVSPDGQYIAGGGADGLLRVWEAATLREIATLREGTHSPVYSVQFSATGALLASGHADGGIQLWEITRPRPQLRHVLRGLRSYVVSALAFAPDARTLASGSNDGIVRLWDLTRPPMGELPGVRADDRAVTALAFSADGKALASAGRDDNAVRIWDVAPLGRLAERFSTPLRGHQSDVTALAFTPAGDRLFSTSNGRFLRTWDTADGKQLAVQELARTATASAAFSPDGRAFVMTPGPTYNIQFWDLTGPEPKERFRLPTSSHGTTMLALANGGKALVAAGNHRLQVWDVAAKPRVVAGTDDPIDVRSVALARDGRALATGGYGGRVRLWDLGNVEPVEQAALNAHAGMVTSVRFSPSGQQLASAGYDGAWRLWNVEGGKATEGVVLGGKSPVTALEFSADGRTIAVACQDHTIRLYDLSSGKPVQRGETLTTSAAPGEIVIGLAIDSQGKNLAARFLNRTGRLWDLNGPKPRSRELRYPQNGITAVDFSPDGATLAVGTTSGVRLWDLAPEPKERGELAYLVPSGPVQAVAFAPDSRTLAVSYAGRLVLWDVGAQKTTREWEFPGGVDDLAFGPDGRHLVTANSNGTVYVLRLSAPVFR